MKVIAITNQKGGVAKTTTSAALAIGLAKRGKKILLIDLDPQANLSYALDVYGENNTIYEILKNKLNFEQCIQKVERIDFIPSNIFLSGAETEFMQLGREYILKEKLDELSGYDYIIIDTPPNLGILTINSIVSADRLIIPTTMNIFAIKGINQLYKIIKRIQERYNKRLKVSGILLTRFQGRTNITKELNDFVKLVAEKINTQIFDTVIRNSVKIEESQANQEDIYLNKGIASEDYDKFVDEFLKKENE